MIYALIYASSASTPTHRAAASRTRRGAMSAAPVSRPPRPSRRAPSTTRARVRTRAIPPVVAAAVSGGVAACVSHSASVPLDVVKTKLQTETFEDVSALGVAREIARRHGVVALTAGWTQTFVGYGLQGALKYGGFDAAKRFASVDGDGASLVTLALCAMCAEIVGSAVLTPMEQMRIRAVSDAGYGGLSFGETARRFGREGGFGTTLGNLPVIYAKMLPYTAVQLVSYDVFTRVLADSGLTSTVTTRPAAAMLAGVLASLASQPGDTVLSVLNKGRVSGAHAEDGGTSIQIARRSAITVASELGAIGLMTGWRARLLHTGSVVFVQLLIYDFIRDALAR